jgi:SAM-dependent methyltransferase
MPRGARTLLSAGCSGRWYFDWIEQEYGAVPRHVGVERYVPRPDHLPDNVEWISTSVASVPQVADGSVDLVFSGQNIEHLFGDDCTGFLLECARVVRPGGHLVMDSPNREIAGLHAWSMNEHTIEFTPEEAAELVTLAGFEVTALRGIWLARDPDSREPLPLDPVTAGVPAADVLRRIELAAAHPEHSFIWWLEAERADRAPAAEALRGRHAEIFATAWPERTNRFLSRVGSVRQDPGGRVVAADAGQWGYLMLGPCMPFAPAAYEVTFTLRRPGHEAAEDGLAAVLDVVAEGGADRVLAVREVRIVDLPPDQWVELPLAFSVDELRWTGEFRVVSTGLVALEARMSVTLRDPGSPVWPSLLRAVEAP